jgi:MoxR-like ATPase
VTSPESESVPLHAGSGPQPARIRSAARQGAHAPGAPAMPLEEVRRLADLILGNVDAVLSGKHDATRMALTVFLSGGHLLIEDVPGVGKTMLAKALARSVDCTVNRIQFTPDLLPSDVTGVSVYSQADHRFEFQPGAVFANIVIGDEINRASPKTQSALLECMEEGQVTVDGVTHGLQQPFTVVATQNPVEMEGTYALPEAQRDRFMARISMGYPDAVAELAMLRDRDTVSPLDELQPVVDADELDAMMRAARGVYVSDPVSRYTVAIVQATRGHEEIRLGASPRATLQLIRAAKTRAALDGRDFVLPDDIDALAAPVLAHRLVATGRALGQGGRGQAAVVEILERIVASTSVPLSAAGRTR